MNRRTYSGNHTGASYPVTTDTDRAYVSGTCRRTDPDLCSIIQKKYECQNAIGKNNSWIEEEIE